jgi:nitrite reductase (NADH) small subunit
MRPVPWPEAREYDLGPLERIPAGEGKPFVVAGTRASQADCPHRGGPLADGMLGERVLVCPLHGHRFELTSGQPLGHGCGALATYPVRIGSRGQVLLTLAPVRAPVPSHL